MRSLTHKWFLPVLITGTILSGCETTKTVYVTPADTTPPSVPRGVYSVTGDHVVSIFWYGGTDEDLAGYRVWRADRPDADYTVITRIDVDPRDPGDPPVDWQYDDTHVSNGHTYYFAVTAFDFDDNESDLSYEDVFDTPRPAGENVLLDANRPSIAAFSLEDEIPVPRGDDRGDVALVYDPELDVLYIEAIHDDTYIQDFGFTESLDNVDWAPESGYSALHRAEVIPGHAYVVEVFRDAVSPLPNFGKLRVTSMGSTWARIDWAYQIDRGNPELKRAVRVSDSTGTRGGA
jgi:hypothetical protein